MQNESTEVHTDHAKTANDGDKYADHRAVLEQLFKHYERMLADRGVRPVYRNDASLGHARWFCQYALENIYPLPIDKLNRWLGFIQGVLILHGITSVANERDFTRPLLSAVPVK